MLDPKLQSRKSIVSDQEDWLRNSPSDQSTRSMETVIARSRYQSNNSQDQDIDWDQDIYWYDWSRPWSRKKKKDRSAHAQQCLPKHYASSCYLSLRDKKGGTIPIPFATLSPDYAVK